MEQLLSEIKIQSTGEGFTNLTDHINNWIFKKRVDQGIIIISTKHTSCSLIINENADPNVLKDLSSYMKALVPEESYQSINGKGERKSYLHSQEGPDDMPAHIKTALTCSSISLSIRKNKLLLGTWQAIYLWEHRSSNNTREVNLHALGNIIQQKL